VIASVGTPKSAGALHTLRNAVGFYDEIKQELIDQLYNTDLTDDEVEETTVKFNDGSTPNRPIRVNALRSNAEKTGQTSSPALTVHVVNDATYGITSAELNTGKITFLISARYGQTPKDIHIRRIESHDPAELVLVLL
jgi:hypothetical protein